MFENEFDSEFEDYRDINEDDNQKVLRINLVN